MTLKIGSIVRPAIGPHKNESHEIVHIFEDGHANIRLIEGEALYEHGLVTCDPKHLVEETLTEEYREPHGSWFHHMSVKAKESYRKHHPDAQGTFGQEPGSSKFHRLKSNAHQKYADFHSSQMDHHREKAKDYSIKKNSSEQHAHHSNLSREHGHELYNHHMKAAHHSVLASGASPNYHSEPGPSDIFVGR